MLTDAVWRPKRWSRKWINSEILNGVRCRKHTPFQVIGEVKAILEHTDTQERFYVVNYNEDVTRNGQLQPFSHRELLTEAEVEVLEAVEGEKAGCPSQNADELMEEEGGGGPEKEVEMKKTELIIEGEKKATEEEKQANKKPTEEKKKAVAKKPMKAEATKVKPMKTTVAMKNEAMKEAKPAPKSHKAMKKK